MVWLPVDFLIKNFMLLFDILTIQQSNNQTNQPFNLSTYQPINHLTIKPSTTIPSPFINFATLLERI